MMPKFISGLAGEARTNCLRFWQIQVNADDWQERLLAAWTDPVLLGDTMLHLDPPSARVVSLLATSGGIQPRSWLVSKSGYNAEQMESILQNLLRSGFLAISKNRSKLDDSADRVALNESIAACIATRAMLAELSQKPGTLRISSDGAGPRFDPATLFEVAGNCLPVSLVDEFELDMNGMPGAARRLALLENGFESVWTMAPRNVVAGTGHQRLVLTRLDGLAMISLSIRQTTRSRMRACEGTLPGKREMNAFAEAHGFDADAIRDIYSWLAEKNWNVERDGVLVASSAARAWLRLSPEERQKILVEEAKADGFIQAEGRPLAIATLFASMTGIKRLATLEEYRTLIAAWLRFVRLLRFYWLAGVISLHGDEFLINKIAAVDYKTLAAQPPGPLVVSGDMTVIASEKTIGPVAGMLLAAFTKVEADSGTLRAKIGERLFFDGLAAGFDGAAFLLMLEAASAQPLAQNIGFTIRDWTSSVAPAVARRLVVLHLGASHIDILLHDPALAKLVDRRAGPDDIILKDCDERELGVLLERHGIMLDYDEDG